MEVEMYYAADAGEMDLAACLLSEYSNFVQEDIQHLCTAVGVISQTIKDRSMPLTAAAAAAYFDVTATCLGRLSRNPESCSGSDSNYTPLLEFITHVLMGLPPGVLSSGAAVPLAESLSRILGFDALPDSDIRHGLMCASRLLVVAGAVNWPDVAPLYTDLLRFITDPRKEVREGCHICIARVLKSFKRSAIIEPMTKEIESILARLVQFSCCQSNPSNAYVCEISYILDALKYCLSLTSSKFTNNFLKHFKHILDMRQPSITKKVVVILGALCRISDLEVAPELLLDLMCHSALSANDKGISADELVSRAMLLRIGTSKVYGLNKVAIIDKLPIIFTSLGDILSRGDKEAAYHAAEASIKLIRSCLDERIVKQGVEHIGLNAKTGMAEPGSALFEKIRANIQGSLSSSNNDTDWAETFRVLSAAFDQLGNSSLHLMTGTIRSLADMEKLPDKKIPFKNQLHECIGSAIVALGPETFLSILPLNLDTEDSSDTNIWLLPILRRYIVGGRISYFIQFILDKVKLIQHKSIKLKEEGHVFSARDADGLIYSLWSLLPAFCNYPVDTSSSFKHLQKILCKSLRQEHELHGIICRSVQILIRQNNTMLFKSSDMPGNEIHTPGRKVKEFYTSEIAEENLKAILSFSFEFFSVLSEVFLACPKDSRRCLQSTMHELAAISDKKVVTKAFKLIMQKLLDVIRQVNVEQLNNSNYNTSSNLDSLLHTRSILLDLVVTLVPGLGSEEVDLLFCAIKIFVEDEEGALQKKAYKVLSTILKEKDGFLSRNLDELLELMRSTLPSCHSSAKRYRLEGLYFLVVHIVKGSEQRTEHISDFTTEIILALKEANKKTRNRAHALLVEIGHACGDEEQGGGEETLQQFFNMVAGRLTGETPHMISAAVTALAYLAYEFSDLIDAAYKLLPYSFLLLQRRNRQIVKANLCLMKILVAKSNSDGLQTHLKGMVEGLLMRQDNTTIRFKAKVESIIDLLVQKCGLAAVKAVIPEEHMKLLTDIQKTHEWEKRKAISEDDTESDSSISSVSWYYTPQTNERKKRKVKSEDDAESCFTEKPLFLGSIVNR